MAEGIERNGIIYTLAAIEEESWTSLLEGSLRTKDPFHQPVFGTISNDTPALRTVVLRKIIPESREIFLHTDIRSRKVEEIKNNANVSWLFYNFEKKLQLRINGIATLHTDDAIADEAWNITGMNSRKTYLIQAAPSSVTDVPENSLPASFADRDPTPEESMEGRKHFCVIVTRALQLDWLWLNSKGHKRALFTYNDGEGFKAEWLIP